MKIKPLYEYDDQIRELIIKRQLAMVGPGGTVTGPVEGTFGAVYSIVLKDSGGTRVAAKCPIIKKFGSPDKARLGLEQVLHELEKTHRIWMVPWINRFFDVKIIQGWPFLLSRYHDGTLEDLIANPLSWSLQDRFATLVQIVRALRMMRDRGVSAHQDLKPGNVFFSDLTRKGVARESKGMHLKIYVGDFGLADAFRDLGRSSGSRPYMAPEQFKYSDVDLTLDPSFDTFALGVIAFEAFTDGMHPLGITTTDVFPPRSDTPQKWKREKVWREWALKSDKSTLIASARLPKAISDIVTSSLAVEPAQRPSLEEIEKSLWNGLCDLDPDTHKGLRMQIDHFEGFASGDDSWPHMEERLMKLRMFYSQS